MHSRASQFRQPILYQKARHVPVSMCHACFFLLALPAHAYNSEGILPCIDMLLLQYYHLANALFAYFSMIFFLGVNKMSSTRVEGRTGEDLEGNKLPPPTLRATVSFKSASGCTHFVRIMHRVSILSKSSLMGSLRIKAELLKMMFSI